MDPNEGKLCVKCKHLWENTICKTHCRWLEENPNAGRGGDGGLDEEEAMGIEYDADGNPIAPDKPKYIDPLPPIDHSTIEYKPFEKNFYNEHADIASLSNIQVRFWKAFH